MLNSSWIIMFYIFVTVISAFLMLLFLLAIVERKKGDKMMKYRFIFAADWMITMIFMITRAMTQPRLLIAQNTLFVITDTSEIVFNRTIKSVLLCIGESFYATYSVLFAVHFYFRLLSTINPNAIKKWQILLLSVLPVITGVFWSLCLFFVFSSTSDLSKILAAELQMTFPEAYINNIVFIALGGHVEWFAIAALSGFISVMVVSISVLVYSLRKSILNVKNLSKNKCRTASALTVQIFIPIIFQKLPIIFYHHVPLQL